MKRKRPGDRTSPISWFNRGLAAKPPFDDPSGAKGFWTGLSRAPAHRVTRYRISLPRLSGEPWRIVLLADLHVGSQAGDVARLARIVEETNALKPDLVLLLGDYVNMMPFAGGRVPPWTIATILARLEAPAGRFAVFGNHEWKYGYEAVAATFAKAGIPLIDNRLIEVARGIDRLALLGLADDCWGEPELALLEAAPRDLPLLVATHDPGLYHDMPDGTLMVAGHLHGGQILVAGAMFALPSGRALRRWASGHCRERGGHLVVSRGLGVSGLPWRLGVPPEIVLLELTAGRTSLASAPTR